MSRDLQALAVGRVRLRFDAPIHGVVRVARLALFAAGLGAVLAVAIGLRDVEVVVRPASEGSTTLPDPIDDLVPSYLAVGRWVPAADLSWSEASTGWQGISASGLPVIGRSFLGGSMSIGGVQFDAGVGTYPLSEIEYELDRSYTLVRARVGVDDASPPGSSAVFHVMTDARPAYSTPRLHRGEAPIDILVSVAGARTIRLIAAPDDDRRGYANWSDLAFFSTAFSLGEFKAASQVRQISSAAASAGNESQMQAAGQQEAVYVAGIVGTHAGLTAATDAARRRYLISNSDLAIIFDAAGEEPNSFTVLSRPDQRLLVQRVSAHIEIEGDRKIALPSDAVVEEEGVRFQDVEEQPFGRGKRLRVRLRARSDGTLIVLTFTVFPGSRAFLVQADVPSARRAGRVHYAFFTRPSGPGVLLSKNARLISDLTRLRQSDLPDDGIVRDVVSDPGKPLIIRGDPADGALLVVPFDETSGMPLIRVAREPGASLAYVTLHTTNVPRGSASPRVYVEAVETTSVQQIAASYRRFVDLAYPQPRLPDWVRFQWSTWYPFEMKISHDLVARQADLLQRHFGDLGQWNIVLDAGWYVAEGRPGSDLRAVDRRKFPGGIRRLVDYVHERDIKLVIYTTAPYLDGNQKEGNWAGLRGTINRRPDWLIPLGEISGGSYAFDYSHPGLQAYLGGLLRDLFVRYDADGVLLDGLGSVDERLVSGESFDAHGLVPSVVEQTTDIYRFIWERANRLKDQVFIEGGVHNPGPARPYAHTFRLADDEPAFRAAYPASGLVEHIDYATYQKAVLGQRPNLGALTEREGAAPINLAWLQAGIALDSQVTLSFNLDTVSGEDVKTYRALLNHYHPFTGQTAFDDALEPSVIVTRRYDTAYVGLLNRGAEPRTFVVPLASYGLADREYVVFDVSDGKARRARNQIEATLAPHSFHLLVVVAPPSIVWTSSHAALERGDRGFRVHLSGPEHVPGVVKLAAHMPRRVTLDGQTLTEGVWVPWAARYTYESASGLLTVEYDHLQRPRRLEVEF